MTARRLLLCLVGVAILALGLVTHPGARGQGADGFRFEVLAHRGGASRALALDGDRAVIGEGGQVLVVDVRTPAAPQVIGRSPELGDVIEDIALSGPVAFVAAEDGGLVALDLSDPAQPRVSGRYDPGWVSAVAIEGTRAYVRANARLQVVDIADPTAMQVLGTFADAYVEEQVAVVDGIVWAAESNGLNAIDARDPAAMQRLAYIGGHGSADGLAATRDRVFLVSGWAGISVFDVRDPTHPALVASIDPDLGIVNDAVLTDSSLHIAGMDYQGGSGRWVGFVQTFDLSGAPRAVARADTGPPAEAVAVGGNLTYVATAPYRSEPMVRSSVAPGLGIYRGGERIGSLATLGLVTGVAVSQGRALLAAGASGLVVYDVADPWSPSLVGAVDTPGFASGVAADGDVALLADGGSDVRLYDVGEADQLLPLGRFTAAGAVSDVAVEDGVALVSSDTAVEVVDVNTPMAPRSVARLEPGAADGWLHSGLAVLVGGRPALRVVDLATPSQPVVRGEWSPQGGALGVTAGDGLAYVGQRVPGYLLITPPTPGPTVTPGGPTVTPTPRFLPYAPPATAPPDAGRVTVLDIRTPEAPAEVGDLAVEGPVSALAVDVDRQRLFTAGADLTGWRSMLRAIDVSHPASPYDLGGRIDRLAYGGIAAGNLEFRDGLLYVAALDQGFWILRPVGPGEASSTTTPSSGTPSPTPTSNRPPPSVSLVSPADGAVLPQPVVPDGWHFAWSLNDVARAMCTSYLHIEGPGGRSITIPRDGEDYTYIADAPLPADALAPWRWWVDVSCPYPGSAHSAERTFSVLAAGSAPTATPAPVFLPWSARGVPVRSVVPAESAPLAW